MTSTSGLGSTAITLQFDLSTNITADASYVDQAIQAASALLPKNLPTPPPYKIANPADAPILIFAVHSGANPIQELDQYANIHRQSVALALTISIGFLVDDAIVMIENIVRHIEAGKPPLEAALDGAGEIGFTILSITLSLAAVFIPVLFMAGVVGLLFHEFAMTTVLVIFLSGFVSLTLTPMMCVGFLTPESHERQGRFSR